MSDLFNHAKSVSIMIYLAAPEEVANDVHDTISKLLDRIEELEARVKELEGNIIATDKEYPEYGCHVDLFEIKDMKPDECVIDLGRPQDCIYAKGRTDKTTCEYWKPCS